MAAKAPSLKIEPRIRVNRGRAFAFGPGKADLLEQIERTGSISEAAKAMDMSYMRAWTLVTSLDRAFAEPLVSTSRGGHGRGGAALTPTGRKVLALYRAMEASSQAAVARLSGKWEQLLRAKSSE